MWSSEKDAAVHTRCGLVHYRDQPAVDENKQASKTLDTFIGEGLDDQTWLNTYLDMDF